MRETMTAPGRSANRVLAMAAVFLLACGGAQAQRSLQVEAAAKAGAEGQRRIALVIGNARYASAPLRNPVNDARAVSQTLREVGFGVTLLENATFTDMHRAIRGFGDDLAKGGTGLFYYAGHGMQVNGRNYLIPVNADIQREDEVTFQALDANLVLSKMDTAKNALNIVILDACRNNPFARSFRSSTQGLAQMDAPSGTLIAFATAPGSVAADGDGQNGLYTEHLLKAIREPGLPIEHLFKQVRIGVTAATGDRQIPWESSSLKGDFYFVAPRPAAMAEGAQRAQQAAVEQALKQAEARATKEREALVRQAEAERQAMQQRMEAMIRDALKAQREALEAALRAQGGAVAPVPVAASAPAARPAPAPASPAVMAASPVPVPAPPPAALAPSAASPAPPAVSAPPPTQVASIASRPPGGASASTLPAAGDRWQYRTRVGNATGRMLVEVVGASPEGILERVVAMGSAPRTWAHQRGHYLYDLGVPQFAPYLAVYEPNIAGDIKTIDARQMSDCLTAGSFFASCDESGGRVVGRERVTVAAGSYEAIKVEITVWKSSRYGGRARMPFVFWYAPEAGRVVKGSGFSEGERNTATLPEFEFELEGFSVGGVVAGRAVERIDEAAAAPVVLASGAPVAGIASGPAETPSVGDRWEYRYTNRENGRSEKRTIQVTDVTPGGIRERVTDERGATAVYEHGAGAYVSDAGMVQLSPYLAGVTNMAVGSEIAGVTHVRLPDCEEPSGAGGRAVCDIRARVAARERVTVAAGSFEATRVEVQVYGTDGTLGFSMELAYWYAPSAKRIVKATGNLGGTSRLWKTPRFEFELSAMKLR